MKTIPFNRSESPRAFSLRFIISILVIYTFQTAQSQIVNAGFENWDTLYKSPYQHELDSVYHVPGASCGRISKWKANSTVGVVRTTDSYQGMYSIVLHNWYFYAEETLYMRDGLNFKPDNLSGFYKYQTGGTEGRARGSLIVALLRTNGAGFDTIAKGVQYFDSTGSYKAFVTPLQYFSLAVPDSISITVVNSDRNCKTQGICHLLYLDGLSLVDPNASIHQEVKSDQVALYPNPVSNFMSVNLKGKSGFIFRLYDLQGVLLRNELHEGNESGIHFSSIETGIYFYQVILGDGAVYSGKLMKE